MREGVILHSTRRLPYGKETGQTNERSVFFFFPSFALSWTRRQARWSKDTEKGILIRRSQCTLVRKFISLNNGHSCQCAMFRGTSGATLINLSFMLCCSFPHVDGTKETRENSLHMPYVQPTTWPRTTHGSHIRLVSLSSTRSNRTGHSWKTFCQACWVNIECAK